MDIYVSGARTPDFVFHFETSTGAIKTMETEAIHRALLLLLSIGFMTGASASDLSCSETARKADLQPCLSAIHQLAMDTQRFWFGGAELKRCRPHKANSIDCYNPHPNKNFSLSELTLGDANTDLSGLDRYIGITYTSKPGTYLACDYAYKQTENQTFTIDPLLNTHIAPWHLRDLPEVTWDDPGKDAFTLVIMDPGFNRLLGLYVNIPGSDISKSDVVQEYTAPLNPRSDPTPMSFVLYKQTSSLSVDTPAPEGFKVGQFAEDNQLQGPLGLTWVLAGYDAYSVGNNKELPSFQNCASLVLDAFLDDHISRPFLPERPELSVHMRLRIDASSFSYPCGSDGNQTQPASSFFVDPIGKPLIHTADVRDDVDQTYILQMNKVNPDNAVDFKDKLYSLASVDPDIPAVAALLGDNERPLLHGLIVNIKGDDVTTGHTVTSYAGPNPPDMNTHFYYFLLYEQKNLLNLTDTSAFTQLPCPAGKLGRCLFNTTAFTSAYDLELVGMTWTTSTRDNYVRCRRDPPQENTAAASSSPALSLLYVWPSIIFSITLIGLHSILIR